MIGGQACAISSLQFESALRLIELMRAINTTPPTHIPGIIQAALNEANENYTPVMKRGRSESVRFIAVGFRNHRSIVAALLQRFSRDEINVVWQRCKKAAILHDWIHGKSIELIERRYTANLFQDSIKLPI